MVRLNITLPNEVAQELAVIRNKSQFIAQTLMERFKREKRQKLQKLLIEGYKASAQNDQELNQEWEKGTLNDGWDK